VAYNDSATAWTLRMAAGSYQAWTFDFTIPQAGSVTPYPVTGATFQYVARPDAADTSQPPLIQVGTTYAPQGLITVTGTASSSSVLLELFQPATAALAPGTYSHALWMYPGDQTSFAWWTGSLIIAGNPQP
jgi:hypothetical protein